MLEVGAGCIVPVEVTSFHSADIPMFVDPAFVDSVVRAVNAPSAVRVNVVDAPIDCNPVIAQNSVATVVATEPASMVALLALVLFAVTSTGDEVRMFVTSTAWIVIRDGPDAHVAVIVSPDTRAVVTGADQTVIFFDDVVAFVADASCVYVLPCVSVIPVGSLLVEFHPRNTMTVFPWATPPTGTVTNDVLFVLFRWFCPIVWTNDIG